MESLALQPEAKGQPLNKGARRLHHCYAEITSLSERTEPLTSESAAQLADDNVTYNLWKFDDMKVLLRCKIHGVLESQAGLPSSSQSSTTSQFSQAGVRYIYFFSFGN